MWLDDEKDESDILEEVCKSRHMKKELHSVLWNESRSNEMKKEYLLHNDKKGYVLRL